MNFSDHQYLALLVVLLCASVPVALVWWLSRRDPRAPCLALCADFGSLLSAGTAVCVLAESCIWRSMDLSTPYTMASIQCGIFTLVMMIAALLALRALTKIQQKSLEISVRPRRVLKRILTALIALFGLYISAINLSTPFILKFVENKAALMPLSHLLDLLRIAAPLLSAAVLVGYVVIWTRRARLRVRIDLHVDARR